MGAIADYLSEKYFLVVGGAAGVVGTAAGVGSSFMLGGLSPLVGIGAGLAAGVGTILFRPRSDDEIQKLLKLSDEADTVKSLPTLESGLSTKGDDTKATAERDIKRILSLVERRHIALGQPATSLASDTLANLYNCLKKWSILQENAEMSYQFNAMVYDYLPNTLSTFLKAPVGSDHEDLKKELASQMGILARVSGELYHALADNDRRAFETQGNFLKSRFGESKSPKLSLPAAE